MLSFATVGEAILVPIFDERKLVKTKLGTMLIGIGTLDDVIEILTIGLAVSFIGIKTDTWNIIFSIMALIVVIVLTFIIFKIKSIYNVKMSKLPKLENIFLVALFMFFLYISIGKFAGSEALHKYAVCRTADHNSYF